MNGDPDAHWRAARLLTSPHRLGFVAAALVMSTAALAWLLWLHGVGAPASTTAPVAPVVHGLGFVYGFMPLFFTGFLLTVGPRWLGLPMSAATSAARTRALRIPVTAFAAAWLAWWALPWLPPALPLAPGVPVAVAALAWTIIVVQLHRLLREPGQRASTHLRWLVSACSLGVPLLWAAATAVAAGHAAWTGALAQAGLWLFCGTVFATASHRILPLDTLAAAPALETRWPLWQLVLLAAMLALQALDRLLALAGPRVVVWHGLLALLLAAPALWLALLAWRWLRLQRLGLQLVAMLHAGMVWLALALALQAVDHGLAALGRPETLGRAPLHALALGWMGSTMLAMVSRVAGAFGGQARVADGSAWLLFALVQLAAVTRVASSLWPAAASWLTTVAGLAWAAAALGWLLVYGRWLGRRPDRPGHLGT